MEPRITSKGQVTIPSALRKALGLRPGDQVVFHKEGDHLILTKRKNDIREAFGVLKTDETASLSDIERAIEQGARGDSS